jgi:hypothetical protein
MRILATEKSGTRSIRAFVERMHANGERCRGNNRLITAMIQMTCSANKSADEADKN